MRILVTGASGLLGLNLCLDAAACHSILGLVNRNPLQTDAFSVKACNLLEEGVLSRVVDEVQPDWIINCAALAIVDACENDPQGAWQMNVELPKRLAALTAQSGMRLLHLSTDAVFDGQRGRYTEGDKTNPLGVYAHTKREGEIAVMQSDPRAIVARVNFFGWSLSGKRSLAEFFFYNLRAGHTVLGFTDVFFCPLLVNDLAHILLQMLEAGLSGLYHVVGSECTSKYDFGLALARTFGLDESLITPASLKDAGLQAPRSPNLTLRSDKLAQDLKRSIPGFSTGLAGLYELYQQDYPQKLARMRQEGGA